MTAAHRANRRRNELVRRLRQQELIAQFGAEALRGGEFAALLDTAAAMAAEGLGTELAKVLEYFQPEEALLIRAGTGWQPGVVGVVKLGTDLASPAGYALRTGAAVISNHLAGEARFRTPEVLATHGVRRAVNVIVQGEAGGPAFGVLEADSTEAHGEFSSHDVDFLQSLANTLGLAADRERDRAMRDLMMREVHHRVKNSLQIAQTVLRLQARASEGEAVAEQLEEAAARIMTIAAVHERLYVGPNFGRVSVGSYLGGLIDDLRESMGTEQLGRAVALEMDAEAQAAIWDADRATNLGLVATELLTNAFKYGIGAITLRFEAADGAARMIVENEGSGPPEDFDPMLSRGLGMRLLAALLRGGSLKIDRTAQPGHCRFIATFGTDASP